MPIGYFKGAQSVWGMSEHLLHHYVTKDTLPCKIEIFNLTRKLDFGRLGVGGASARAENTTKKTSDHGDVF